VRTFAELDPQGRETGLSPGCIDIRIKHFGPVIGVAGCILKERDPGVYVVPEFESSRADIRLRETMGKGS
jgi:hypothetical protein